jgi:hypothetical protein
MVGSDGCRNESIGTDSEHNGNAVEHAHRFEKILVMGKM